MITTVDHRADLSAAGHTITVETLTPDTARKINQPKAAGQLAVIERMDGRAGKICATQQDLRDGTIEDSARSYAHTYGATYMPSTPAAKIPYDAANVIYRDLGLDVVAVWTDDPKIARQLKTGDRDTFERLCLSRAIDVEVIGGLQRVRKIDGYTHSGWLLDVNDGLNPVGTRKPEAIAQLREAVVGYFNR